MMADNDIYLTMLQKVVKEVKIWAKLKHPNVLPLLGVFVDPVSATPNFVSEWMENGTAAKYMRDFPRGGRKTLQVVRMFFDRDLRQR